MTKEDRHTRSRVHDLLGGVIGLFACVMIATIRWQIDASGPDPFYKGPMIFPLIILFLMVLGALPSMWRLIRPIPNSSWFLDGHGIPYRTMAVALLLAVYPMALTYIGLEISTLLFLVIGLTIVKQNTPAKIILIPLAITAIIYLMFKLFLDIWFPTPLLFEIFLE